MKLRYLRALLCLAIACCAAAQSREETWKTTLLETLPAYGHRNWIVVADSAYPEQSRLGIQTVVAQQGQIQVLQEVLRALSGSRHVRAIVYTDQELQFLDDNDAPGIGAYKRELASSLGDRPVNSLPHEQIIGKLDQVSQTFRVLIIKTNMTLPYTSVFLQLDCAYWSADAEGQLRAKMAAQGPK